MPVNSVRGALKDTQTVLSALSASSNTDQASSYERELQWLVISKATTQTYGWLISVILDQTLPLSQDIGYWDSILDSYRYTALYSLQTSPLRLLAFGKDVYRDVRARGGDVAQDGWKQFYGLVKQVVQERNLQDVRHRVISPVTRIRSECQQKRSQLKRMRAMNANALGILLGEGLSNQSIHEKGLATPVEAEEQADTRDKWRGAVLKNIALMDAVLKSVSSKGASADAFDAAVGNATEDDQLFQLGAKEDAATASNAVEPAEAVQRLQAILANRLTTYQSSFADEVRQYGKPSRLIRYWLPAILLFLSSSTLLRIVANRKVEITTWIAEFGVTVRDFWANWVVEPTRRVIGTIRHDEGSEISIMSKRSLEGDRESLERMVVDFAVKADKANLSEAQIADIRTKVKEGDLTPVLKAYEKDLQSPFKGALFGNLVQALLIQVQKTKVDVEVAMGGIDGMLKSQELLFGLIGLTPGLLISVFLGRWLYSTFGSRKSIAQGRQAGQLLRTLRYDLHLPLVQTCYMDVDFCPETSTVYSPPLRRPTLASYCTKIRDYCYVKYT